jgi:uncharacterized protein (TIGR04255 family)
MPINEVFPNPMVKQVIFQIIFPNLFYMENKIGDLQVKVMKEFPQSSLLLRRQFVFVDKGEEGKLENIPPELDKEAVKKIWQFKSNKDVTLNVLTNSLDISSPFHKTYNLGETDKFRDILKFVLDSFFEVAPIPIINRIGLRYIDECPIPVKNNKTFREYYDSVFPLDRFNLADANEMEFRTVVKRNEYFLHYKESLKRNGDGNKLILDFDGFAENIEPKDYLKTTDALHKIISEEYKRTIKEPVYKLMRQKRRVKK